MNILKSLGIKSQTEKIVERLLNDGHVSPAEAIILLRKNEKVIINVKEISSGAKVVSGDDNSVEQR